MGKDRAYYSDFWDAGSFVIVENVENMIASGKKLSSAQSTIFLMKR